MRVGDADSAAVMSEGRLLGIITERDLVRAIADGINPQQTRADVIMSADPATVTADDDVAIVAVKMMNLGIRHLPVLDSEGSPIGLISARDLVAVLERGKGS
jgi:CBS domain-containing protein